MLRCRNRCNRFSSATENTEERGTLACRASLSNRCESILDHSIEQLVFDNSNQSKTLSLTE